MHEPWYFIKNAGEVPSPALLIHEDGVERNIRKAINIARNPARLRPHVKTHKLAEIVRMHVAAGVSNFKCATIAEAEMTAGAGGSHVLLGYQPVGPNIQRLALLAQRFPDTRFAAVADDPAIVKTLSDAFRSIGCYLDMFLDIDCGMRRTGITSRNHAIEIFKLTGNSPGLRAAGLHAYDGHIHDSDVGQRNARARESFGIVQALKDEMEAAGLAVPTVIAGGTPTFPFHAASGTVECSPGTYVLWDFGYGDSMPDLSFEIAAVLLTRVVSKPGLNRLCLDLGHKAVASESPFPRVKLLEIGDATHVMHSEEHLVIETPFAHRLNVGDIIYAVPRHICPTVALHNQVVVVRKGEAQERWRVRARDRAITI
jgi:D-serine deaminase-like pyridoxal phosphate-dependent protein